MPHQRSIFPSPTGNKASEVVSLQDGQKFLVDELFPVIRRHSKGMGCLGSSGNKLVREQLRMHNVTRPLIQKCHEILAVTMSISSSFSMILDNRGAQLLAIW
jgi:hypothetical protein